MHLIIWLAVPFPLHPINTLLAFPTINPSRAELERRTGGQHQRTQKHLRVSSP